MGTVTIQKTGKKVKTWILFSWLALVAGGVLIPSNPPLALALIVLSPISLASAYCVKWWHHG